MKKRWHLYTFSALALVLALGMNGCNAKKNKNKSAKEQIEANRMNFPNLKRTKHQQVVFELSDIFRKIEAKNMALTPDAGVYCIEELQCYLIVERFDQDELRKHFGKISITDGQELNLMSSYAALRAGGLPLRTSIVKAVALGKNNKGYLFSLSLFTSKNIEEKYLMATGRLGDSYYLFQLSGPAEIMNYFYDDFLVLLKSIGT